MAVIISRVGVQWGHAFDGFLPSDALFKNGALYTCMSRSLMSLWIPYSPFFALAIGIIGATVMPHSLFLGSALATQDRLSIKDSEKQSEATTMTGITSSTLTANSQVTLSSTTKSPSSTRPPFLYRMKRSIRATFRIIPLREFATEPENHKDRDNNSYTFVRAHIYHGMFDIVFSLLSFAVLINALLVFLASDLLRLASLNLPCRILILASAVFFYGSGAGSGGPASLFDAHDLLRDIVGKGTVQASLHLWAFLTRVIQVLRPSLLWLYSHLVRVHL